MKEALPLARKESLIIKEVENETLVYDLETDQAHCLNDTAARIWKSCDGKTTVNDISSRLNSQLNSSFDDNVVWLALDQLEKFKLLSHTPAKPAHLSGISRRQAVRAVGLAAIMLPMISSIVVPSAMAQGSPVIIPQGGCCVNPSDCGPGGSCEQPHAGDPPCVDYTPNPQNSTKQCY
jgi:hypothetical protein